MSVVLRPMTAPSTTIVIHKNAENNLKSKITDSSISVSYPESSDIKNEGIQEFIKAAIIKTLRREAKEYLKSEGINVRL